MGDLTALTRVGDSGQEIYAFELPWETAISRDEVSIKGNYLDSSIDCFLAMKTNREAEGIKEVCIKGNVLHIETAPFSCQAPYRLRIGEKTYTSADVSITKTLWADKFRAARAGEVLYRIYEPGSTGMRPLILFLHGGGESGRDNWKQLVGCFGPAYLAQSYPDCYVMAPQAKGHEPTPEELEAFRRQTFASSGQQRSGWDREYLAEICDIIREMIREGKVNPERVYVTGLSMGGAGTLRALSVAPDLFAAAVPVCPSMTPETYHILRGLTRTRIWITASYIDHTLYRHKYLVDGIMHLRDAGNQDAHLTLYSPEELAQYGIGVIPDMPLEARFGWNHTCWILTYHDFGGTVSWMMEQTKRNG